MESYKRGGHTVWDLKYHIVWTTKYRYKVLAGDVGLRTRELLREIAQSQEMVTAHVPQAEDPDARYCSWMLQVSSQGCLLHGS